MLLGRFPPGMLSLPISAQLCAQLYYCGMSFPCLLQLYGALFVQLHTQTGAVHLCFNHPFQDSYSAKAFRTHPPLPLAAVIVGAPSILLEQWFFICGVGSFWG